MNRIRHVALDMDGTIYKGGSLCAQFEHAGFTVTWDAPEAVVVFTGEATAGDDAAPEDPPDLVLADIGEFGTLLLRTMK